MQGHRGRVKMGKVVLEIWGERRKCEGVTYEQGNILEQKTKWSSRKVSKPIGTLQYLPKWEEGKKVTSVQHPECIMHYLCRLSTLGHLIFSMARSGKHYCFHSGPLFDFLFVSLKLHCPTQSIELHVDI